MTSLSQSPRNRILWILANNGGKMERSRLRTCTRMKYALLIPILEELVRKGKIKLTLITGGEAENGLDFEKNCGANLIGFGYQLLAIETLQNFTESPHELQHRDNERICGSTNYPVAWMKK